MLRSGVLLVLATFLGGCFGGSNDPINTPAWTHDIPENVHYATLGMQQTNAGNVLYAIRTPRGDSIPQGNGQITVKLLNNSGAVMQEFQYADPYYNDPENPYRSSERLINLFDQGFYPLANGELLLVSEYGTIFRLSSEGVLLNQFNVKTLGYDFFYVSSVGADRWCVNANLGQEKSFICYDLAGNLLLNEPLGVSQTRYQSSLLNATSLITPQGDLIWVDETDTNVMLRKVASNAGVSWQVDTGIQQESGYQIESLALIGDNLVAAVAKETGEESFEFEYWLYSKNGESLNKISNTGIANGAGVVPFNSSSFLVISPYERGLFNYNKAMAKIRRIDLSGELLALMEVNMSSFGLDKKSSAKELDIEVVGEVIYVLQNRKSFDSYLVYPIPNIKPVDKLFVSQYSGDGKLLREDAISVLKYTLGYEGLVTRFDQYGFYPEYLSVSKTGDRVILAGENYLAGPEDYEVDGRVAAYDLK